MKATKMFRQMLLTLAVGCLAGTKVTAQTTPTIEQRLEALEALQRSGSASDQAQATKNSADSYKPQLHGILRGKYEYQPDLDASRFEVRNARLSVSGSLPLRSEYKLEVDLCDESAIKMKDAWVRLTPWRTLRISVGQQRLPFSIDAHRNPSAQYFANRSFIAKQTGDTRDVGAQLGYTFAAKSGRTVVIADAGIFNGSNLDNQRTAWHSDFNYSARLQVFPVSGLALVPSIQHTAIADRRVHFTSLDFGAYYETGGLHLEAEYLHKRYSSHAFDPCDACNLMTIYRQRLKSQRSYFEAVSYLLRYDYMADHTDGRSGFQADCPTRLVTTDYARHRLTAGLTFSVRNKWFPTDLRLNYEKYWYPHNGTAKESEQDKLVAEIMIRF